MVVGSELFNLTQRKDARVRLLKLIEFSMFLTMLVNFSIEKNLTVIFVSLSMELCKGLNGV